MPYSLNFTSATVTGSQLNAAGFTEGRWENTVIIYVMAIPLPVPYAPEPGGTDVATGWRTNTDNLGDAWEVPIILPAGAQGFGAGATVLLVGLATFSDQDEPEVWRQVVSVSSG